MTDRQGGDRVYFDTTVFCEAFEGASDKADALKAIFELGKRKTGTIVTSELTFAELAPGENWVRYSRFYLNLIVFNDFIDPRPVTRSILLETGDYRRALGQTQRKLKLPDAIHAVTAIRTRCRYRVTSDQRFPVPRPLKRVSSDPTELRGMMNALDA